MKLITLLAVAGLALAQLQATAVAPLGVHEKPEIALQWHIEWNQALAAANKENKPIFMYFTGSDWNDECKKIDREIVSTDEFKAALGNRLIFMKVDYSKQHRLPAAVQKQNNQLKDRYGINKLPTIIIVDATHTKQKKFTFIQDTLPAFVSKVEAFIN